MNVAPAESTTSRAVALHVNAVGAVMGGARRHLAPFIAAVVAARPDWAVTLWVSAGVDLSPVPSSVDLRVVPRLDPVRRMWWESTALVREVRADERAVLVNLTNSGPLRSSRLSLVYQRNPIWFDPSWVAGRGVGFRLEAMARRLVAYAQMRAATAVVVPSAAMAGYLACWRGAPRTPVVVIPHAVDTDRFRFEPRPWPPPITRRLRLLSVSHGAPHKGQELLPALLAALLQRNIDAEVWLTVDRADAPAYVDRLRAEAARHRVAERFQLLGRVDDVERLYRDADVMVFPSLTESFGFPVLEAMAAGLPVVASRIASSVELLGDNGWWYAPGSVDGACDAVSNALATSAGEMAGRLARSTERAAALSWTANARALTAEIERRR
jgi:glycosyltransferase involved in cell wall biosynthesis